MPTTSRIGFFNAIENSGLGELLPRNLLAARISLRRLAVNEHGHVERIDRPGFLYIQESVVALRQNRRYVIAPVLGSRIIDDTNRSMPARLQKALVTVFIVAIEDKE